MVQLRGLRNTNMANNYTVKFATELLSTLVLTLLWMLTIDKMLILSY